MPAYNTREEALDFHPKANRWVGYVLELGGITYYHAGDTDHAPELSDVRSDVALLPIGGHYTMNAVEAGGLARAIAPRLAVPMHFGFVVGSPSDGEPVPAGGGADHGRDDDAGTTRSSGPEPQARRHTSPEPRARRGTRNNAPTKPARRLLSATSQSSRPSTERFIGL